MVEFPVSGVETWWWLPPLVAFGVSCVAATGGLSGAFLMLPFQVSVLGFTGPGASPTNLLFNVVGTPSGVYRYYREKRMLWVLSAAIIAGSLPGMILGALIRVTWMPEPTTFKGFVGVVLGFIGLRLLQDVIHWAKKKTVDRPNNGGSFTVTDARFTLREVRYVFLGDQYRVPTAKILLLAFVVGILGGAYGIGGGAVIAPFLVSFFGLPVYAIAGATLFSNFASSLFGILVYWLIDLAGITHGVTVSPDWLLGLSMGIGGAFGMYAGARLQRYLPVEVIKIFLTAFLILVAGGYLWEALLG